MNQDPAQTTPGTYPPGAEYPAGDYPPPSIYPPPPRAYQPPEGTNPGTYPHGQPYGQPPYYAPTYPGPMAPSTSGWAIASLALSLAGIVPILPVIGSLLGVIFGHIALGEIKRAQGRLEGRGMAVTGLVLGYVVLGLEVCVLAGIVAAGILGAHLSSS
jgi:hypothetical protein